MARTVSNNALVKSNDRAIKRFANDIETAMYLMGRSTITQAAQIGLHRMVNTAGFNDYTGKLINSYQAAIITKGGIEARIKRQRTGVVFNDTKAQGRGKIFGGGGKPILMTSLGMEGTTPISHRTTKKKFKMRYRRDSGESPELRKPQFIWGKKEKSYEEGFGRYYTKLKGIRPGGKTGYWVVFTNAAPFAEEVEMAGPNRHRVFPTSYEGPNLFVIGEQELRKVIKMYKTRYKR